MKMIAGVVCIECKWTFTPYWVDKEPLETVPCLMCGKLGMREWIPGQMPDGYFAKAKAVVE